MFDIFIKPSTVHVDCFTAQPTAYNYAPIDYASNFYPEWWRKLPKESYGHQPKTWIPYATMKTCAGFLALYQNSLITPMWTDLTIQTSETNLEFAYAQNWMAERHPEWQRGDWLKNYHHLKLVSPWMFSCKKEIYWSFQKPMYNFDNPLDFILFDGVIEFKYQNSANINLGFKKTNKTSKIAFKQPLVLMTPQTEKRMKFKNHLLSDTEFDKMSKGSSGASITTTINRYVTNKRIQKEKEKGKCPFGF